MDVPAHALAQRAIHELMALERALALELRSYDDRFEMRVIVALHTDLGAGQAGFDERLDFGGFHGGVERRKEALNIR